MKEVYNFGKEKNNRTKNYRDLSKKEAKDLNVLK
jgi:hypothetical protein